MFKMRITVFIVFIMSIVLAQDTTRQLEELDPNSLKDPGPDWPMIINSPLDLQESSVKEKVVETQTQVINGFRVQVLATRYAEKADSLKNILSLKLEEKVYVTFEAPNYKVRVGDCTDRKQAEDLRNKMQKNGFATAWIIRERIEWQD